MYVKITVRMSVTVRTGGIFYYNYYSDFFYFLRAGNLQTFAFI